MKLERTGDVFVLDIGDGENRFHPDWIGAFNATLDEVESAPGPKVLVTAATGKFWSNGLDLDWVRANPDEGATYLWSVHRLFARVLVLGVPTVASIQGHCFAAGAMISLAHDFRVMRADRGFWCLPEVDLGLPFSDGMAALVQARLSKKTAHEAMTTGRRYGGDDALAAGIVDATAAEGEVLSAATDFAAPLAAKASPALAAIKARMYSEAVRILNEPV